MGKPIGELQGWWAASQKVLLATWPMILAFGAWQVRQTFGLAAQIQEERIEARAYTDKAVSGALAQVFLEISNLKTTIATMPAPAEMPAAASQPQGMARAMAAS